MADRRPRRAPAWVGGALALGAAACGTFTSYQTAEPVAPGRWRLAGAITAGQFRDLEQASQTPTTQLELELRRGVHPRGDVGLKLYTVGAELSTRWRVSDGPWAWALLGSLASVRNQDRALVADGLLAQARLGAVTTRRTSRRWAFSVGPSLTAARYWFDGGGRASGLLGGVTGNVSWSFSRRWHLIPEVGLHATLRGDVPVDGLVGYLGVGVGVDL